MQMITTNERIDDLNRNGLQIIQDPKLFCFGMDAVLLTSIVRVEAHERALDLGTGTGIIPILLTAKTKGKNFVGLEIHSESVGRARRSVELNNLQQNVTIDEGDIRQASAIYKPASFHVITANPPYMPHGSGLVNPCAPRAIARHEILCTLEDCVSAAAALLRPHGRLYMVHRPHRLADIIDSLRRHGLEPKYLRLVHPYAGKEPNMLLLSAVKGGRPMLTVGPPLFVYEQDGKYTEEVMRIYYG